MRKAAPLFIRVSGQIYRLATKPALTYPSLPLAFKESWVEFDKQVLSFADMKRDIARALQTKNKQFFEEMGTSARNLAAVLTDIATSSDGFAGKTEANTKETPQQQRQGIFARRTKMAKKTLPKYIRVNGQVYRLANEQTAPEPDLNKQFAGAWNQFSSAVQAFSALKAGIMNALKTKDVAFFTDMQTQAAALSDLLASIASFAEQQSGQLVTGKTKKTK